MLIEFLLQQGLKQIGEPSAAVSFAGIVDVWQCGYILSVSSAVQTFPSCAVLGTSFGPGPIHQQRHRPRYVPAKQTAQEDDVTVLPADPRYTHPYRLFLNTINCYRLRMRYYFVWILADSINNCAGVGFAGYDEKGRAKWDLVSNINIWGVENATSFRMIVINWNTISGLWLRR